MQPYTYELAANQTIPITSSGNLVACLDAAAPFTVAPDGKYPVDWRQGLTLRFPMPFRGVVLVNGPTAQTITLLLGEGDANVPIPSIVDVNDSGAAVSKAGKAFIVPSGISAGASNYAHHQIWNPADSGNIAIIKKIEFQSSNVSTSFSGGFYETAIGSQANSKNKDSGEPNDTVVQHRWVAQSTIVSLSTLLWEPYTVGQPIVMTFDRPLIVREGYGFVVVNGTVNQLSRVQFEYELEAA